MKIVTDIEKIDEVLNRATTEVIDREHLKKLLMSGRALRVKFGIDPTSPHIHLGHSVALLKLRQFQDLGHKIVFLIGDFTAMIGDPSGRSETRKRLTEKEVKQNAKTYLNQAGKILNVRQLEIRHNADWFKKGGADLLLEITSAVTLQRTIERDDFQKRLKEDQHIGMVETLYPLLQGYDSVALKSDVEIGGNDQKFNLLMGRRMQRHYNQSEQDVLMVPLLIGTDGVRKMSKSFDNYIAFGDAPDEMYGKIMSIPDSLMEMYWIALTRKPVVEVNALIGRVARGANPRDVKMELAKEIVKMYHGEKAAAKAVETWHQIHQAGQKPTDMQTYKAKKREMPIIDLLVESGLCASKSEARRLIEQKGIRVNDQEVEDVNTVIKIDKATTIQKGKNTFLKIT